MKRRGFTLNEFLIVIGVMAIVLALTFPVVRSSRERANIGASVLRQKQYHAALMLYQADYGGATGYYGRPRYMNLPMRGQELYSMSQYGLTPDMEASPCGSNMPKSWVRGMLPTVYDDLEMLNTWSKEAPVYRENIAIIFDYHCNSPNPAMGSPYVTKRAVLTTLGGRSVVRKGKGYFFDCRSWCDKP